MKKIKTILTLTFCLALLLTTTTVANNYDINSIGHFEELIETPSL